MEEEVKDSPLIYFVEQLNSLGVHHVEIAWSPHPGWTSLMKELQQSFGSISLGAASITNPKSLELVANLGLAYAMTPIWDVELLRQAQNLKQVLIPGVFSPTEIYQASQFGCRLVKLFPASILGIEYLNQLQVPLGSTPFIIAAGGMKISDINPWLKKGFGAIAIGRELTQQEPLRPSLESWLKFQH